MAAEILEFKMIGLYPTPADNVAIAVRTLAVGSTVLIGERPIQLIRGEPGISV